MNAVAGYSGTPLAKKLGLKDGQVAAFVGLPDAQAALPEARSFFFVECVSDCDALTTRGYDVVHLFTDLAATVKQALPKLIGRIKPDGMIWVSWPKKASKVPTDLTEDVIRNSALTGILVDVKVCAVDDVWSGLKLVVRKEHRAQLEKEQQGMV